MKTFSARYRGNRLVELTSDAPLADGAKVLVIAPDPAEGDEAMWSSLTAAQFLEGYGDADAVYDAL